MLLSQKLKDDLGTDKASIEKLIVTAPAAYFNFFIERTKFENKRGTRKPETSRCLRSKSPLEQCCFGGDFQAHQLGNDEKTEAKTGEEAE